MIDIAVHELHQFYGATHVLRGISFDVYSGEKVGLLGKNGSGKTTLFKTITGEVPYESGSIAKPAGKRVEMLAQIPMFGADDTVEDVLRTSFQESAEIYRQMKALEGDADPVRLRQYGRLLEEYERLGGYDIEVRLDKACGGMNIDAAMRRRPFSRLSGGEQTRVNLARMLLRDCDILLLDEPTNHLDLNSLAWLERYLREFSGTVLVISHDRAFLDHVITRVIEIDGGQAKFYKGNYSAYVAEREQRTQTQAEQYEQQQKKIRQLEAAAKRLHQWAGQADNEALHKRAFAMEKRIEQMDRVDRPTAARKLTATFDGGGYASKEMASFDAVTKGYGGQVLVRDLCAAIARDARIALVGANGCGKSTLLRMMMREVAPDAGTIRLAPSAKLAYMPQIITFEEENATVLDTLRFGAGVSVERARSILAQFHFRADDVEKRVAVLSGGEKSRLKLCLLMQNNVNFLLLDEPTNHLDIPSREWIEQALSDFEGTMFFVSHDRYFLNKFATQVWAMEGGVITPYDCGFDAYLDAIRPPPPPPKPRRRRPAPKAQPGVKAEKPVPYEVRITEAEAARAAVNVEIEAAFAQSDFRALNELYEQASRLEEEIDTLYQQWAEDA